MHIEINWNNYNFINYLKKRFYLLLNIKRIKILFIIKHSCYLYNF